MQKRRSKRIGFVLLGVFVAVFLFSFLVQKNKNNMSVNAASLANFDPGYIISDYQMGNYNSMNEAEIQKFLTAKNPCSNTNYNYYKSLSANSKYKWHWANGHFVCLSEERFGDGEEIGSGQSAAHIIWQAAQDYKINPKVLIVLLQKETSLITDPIPNNGDYRKATGYGCPDTAACSSKYYGFKNQIRNAAKLFRTVLDGGWTNFPLGNNYVQYNPNKDCGGSVVNIRSLATSALYRYTPYQPNAGALAAGYGTAYCGAYGNRNFYLYFQDWFGGITSNGNFNNVKYNDVKQVNIESGEYNILAATNGPKAMGTVGASDGGNVQAVSFNDSTNQRWQIEKKSGYYLIRNKNTGKVLDIANGINSNLINVWQFAENGSCAQRWIFGEETGGTVVIHNACNPSYVLDIQGGNSNVQIYNKSRNKNTNQSWVIKKVGRRDYSGTYVINSANNKSLSVVEMMNGDNALFNTSNSTNASQQWQIEKVGNYYVIKNKGSGKVLDVTNGVFSNQRNIWQYAENRSCAQRWIFGDNTNGTVNIHNACYPGYVLDLQDGKTNLQIYAKTYYNNANQNFSLQAAPKVKNYSGLYNIVSSGDKNKALGVSGTLNADNIAVAQANGALASQQWQVEKVDNYYLIRNKASGKVLDVTNGVFSNQRNIWQYAENRSCAQRWMFWENADGSFTIHNACNTSYVLDLEDGKTNLQIYTKTSYENRNQKWVLKKTTPVAIKDYSGIYNILSSVDKNKALGVSGTLNADNIAVAQANGALASQQWQVEKVDNYYLIRNKASGKVLDVTNGVFSNQRNIWQYAENRSCAQRWMFWENADGSFTIHNACNTSYVLDLEDGKTNLQIYTKTSYENRNQKWVLKRL